ncbi:TasA family protein [Nocardioides ferulae]|uniref:TasA family protein n=1 Tax=Nocardioides ferulae TaxID=2340821 RepID=UPI0013DDA887|nr:TasA family protein [Nocardioides ferulae]
MIAKSSATKILASMALVAGAAGVAGLGTFGGFTDSTTVAENAVSSGTIDIEKGATASFAVADLLPGETIKKPITLTRTATSEPFGAVRLTTTITSGTPEAVTLEPGVTRAANLDAAGGLEMTIQSCSTEWSANYVCSGTTKTVSLPTNDVAQSNVDILAATNLNDNASRTANLLVSLKLPDTAGNEFQGLKDTIGFTFNATQVTTTATR